MMSKQKVLFTISALAMSALVFSGCTSVANGSGTQGNVGGTAPASSATAPIASPSGNVSAGIAGNATADSQYITEAQAKNIALENAGFAETDVQFVWSRLEYDNGRAEYDVEFVRTTDAGMEEYDYEIDAVTGEIMSMDREAENYNPNNPNNQTNGTNGQTAPQGQAGNGQYIGEEAAKTAALNHAGLTADGVNFVRAHLDFDDGRWKYEVEFYKDNTEYDYDIDAYSGEILSYDFDAEYYNAANGVQTAPGATVTAEQAKQIALQHAGVAESDTRRMEMDIDYDHGRTVYEFSWKVGWTEYDYDIDASTGEILSYSQEQDD